MSPLLTPGARAEPDGARSGVMASWTEPARPAGLRAHSTGRYLVHGNVAEESGTSVVDVTSVPFTMRSAPEGARLLVLA